jgi:hypothetical protein
MDDLYAALHRVPLPVLSSEGPSNNAESPEGPSNSAESADARRLTAKIAGESGSV